MLELHPRIEVRWKEACPTWSTTQPLIIRPISPKNGWLNKICSTSANCQMVKWFNITISFLGMASKQSSHGVKNKQLLEKVEKERSWIISSDGSPFINASTHPSNSMSCTKTFREWMAPLHTHEIARTVEPLIIESPWVKKLMSTGALEALRDLLVVQTNVWKNRWVPEENNYHL